jgi:hypothetical protein
MAFKHCCSDTPEFAKGMSKFADLTSLEAVFDLCQHADKARNNVMVAVASLNKLQQNVIA